MADNSPVQPPHANSRGALLQHPLKTSLVAVASLVALIMLVTSCTQDRTHHRIASTVREQATVTTHPDVSKKDADYTLFLLDRGLERAGGTWNHNVSVVIHPSHVPMRTQPNAPPLPSQIHGLVTCKPKGPEIHLKAEPNIPLLPDPSNAPVTNHESVHAALCQSLNFNAYHSIPIWFHEGLATAQEYAGLMKLVVNTYRKGIHSMTRPHVTSGAAFCHGRFDIHPSNYRTATMFLSYLEEQYPEFTEAMIQAAREGRPFNQVFRQMVGAYCPPTYDEWSQIQSPEEREQPLQSKKNCHKTLNSKRAFN